MGFRFEPRVDLSQHRGGNQGLQNNVWFGLYYAAVGVTWWLESLSGLRGSFDELLVRVEAGPPA